MSETATNIEVKKLEFERWKAEKDLELRRLEIDQRKFEGGFWSKFTPTSASVIGALIAALAALYSTVQQGKNAIDLEGRKYETAKVLERDKFISTRELELSKQQHDLILRAVSVGDEKQAKANMIALAELGLLKDRELAARVTQLKSPLVLPNAGAERPNWTSKGSGFRVQSDEDILNLILTWEGGFVGHPSEPSGASNAGIGLAALSRFMGRQATLEDLKTLSKEQIRAFYQQNYFEIDGVRQIKNSVIKGALINVMILSGRVRAITWLQTSLSQTVGRTVPADGTIGLLTAQSINEINDIDFLVENFNCTIWSSYKASFGFETFGKGWQRRILAFAPTKLQGVCPDLHT